MSDTYGKENETDTVKWKGVYSIYALFALVILVAIVLGNRRDMELKLENGPLTNAPTLLIEEDKAPEIPIPQRYRVEYAKAAVNNFSPDEIDERRALVAMSNAVPRLEDLSSELVPHIPEIVKYMALAERLRPRLAVIAPIQPDLAINEADSSALEALGPRGIDAALQRNTENAVSSATANLDLRVRANEELASAQGRLRLTLGTNLWPSFLSWSKLEQPQREQLYLEQPQRE